jgi:surface carbohydrate biosynthesis protein
MIQILLDHVTRELTIAAYISLVLEDTDSTIKVSIDHQDLYNRWKDYDYFDRIDKGINMLVSPSYNIKRTAHILSRAVYQKSFLTINHSEQIFLPLFYKEKLNTDFKKAYSRQVSAHLVWGKSFAEKLVQYANVDPTKIFIVGNPKLDLANRLQKSKPTNCQSSTSPRVLIVSDFKLGDYSGSSWGKFQRQYSAHFKYPMNNIYKLARDKCVLWVKQASESFPDVLFLVRPHPGEDISSYKALFEIPNIQITGSQEIAIDAQNADIIFSFTSTSIFEMLSMGKPVFNLKLEDVPDEYNGTHYKAFNWIDKGSFFNLLNNLRNGISPDISDHSLKVLNEHMYDPFGKSLLRSAIALKEINKKCLTTGLPYNTLDRAIGRSYALIAATKYLAIKASYLLKHTFGIDNPIEKYSKKSWNSRLEGPELLTTTKIKDFKNSVSSIISDEDISILTNNTYSLRQQSEGIYIDFN